MYYIALCIVSVLIGGSYYLLFKNNTFLEQIVCKYINIIPTKEILPHVTSVFLQNHFCDLLWAFSLQSGLLAIFLPTKEGKIIISVTVVLSGAVWELFQRFGITVGTGDVIDVIMYVVGSAATLLFTIEKEKK